MSLQKAMSNIIYIKNNRDCATSAQWQIMAILISASHNFEPLPLPSAQGRQGHTHRIALRFPLSPTREENFHYFLTLHQIINRSCPIQINISKNIQYNSGSKEIIVIGRSYSQH